MKYNSISAVEVYWNVFFFYEDRATQVSLQVAVIVILSFAKYNTVLKNICGSFILS